MSEEHVNSSHNIRQKPWPKGGKNSRKLPFDKNLRKSGVSFISQQLFGYYRCVVCKRLASVRIVQDWQSTGMKLTLLKLSIRDKKNLAFKANRLSQIFLDGLSNVDYACETCSTMFGFFYNKEGVYSFKEEYGQIVVK